MDSSSTDADAGMQVRGLEREDIRAAIAKATELRALHAALLRGSGTSLAVARLPGGDFPPFARGVNHLPVPEDCPVFTPSYEEESLPGCHHVNPGNINLSQTWNGITMEEEGKDNKLAVCLDNKNLHQLSISNNDPKISPAIDRLCPNYVAANILKSSGRAGLVEHDAINLDQKCLKKVKSTGASSINLEKPVRMHTRHRGTALSWLLPKSKKKSNPKMSPKTAMESENMSQFLKDWGALSLQSLKEELLEANECKDAALAEVSEMRSLLRELQQKLLSLETYCVELKKALKQPVHANSSYQDLENSKLSKRMKSNGGSKNNSLPVSQEVMVEGFLQMVSEARLSVKQFCKALIHHIEESGDDLSEKLNFLLEQHQIALTDNYSKEVIYHLEALINQSLHRDFENCVFQENGSPKFLDPRKECTENFSSFVALRNLSYSDVLQKGTKYYSEDFSRFCDRKMSYVVSLLNWPSPWPEQLLRCFFISAKCIWLLHLLAFSFSPSLRVLRVDRDRDFDSIYMEEIPLDSHTVRIPSAQVKIMVMPGFYVLERVLRCRVLCRYDSLP